MSFLLSGNTFAYFSIIFIGCIPVIEGKGAMLIGLGLGLNPLGAFLCAYLGSMLPVPFLLTLMQPFLVYLNKTKHFKKISQKIHNYLLKKRKKVEEKAKDKLQMATNIKVFSLFLFVLMPVPGTGTWSGSLMSAAMGFKPMTSFIIIAVGNFLSILLVFLTAIGLFL